MSRGFRRWGKGWRCVWVARGDGVVRDLELEGKGGGDGWVDAKEWGGAVATSWLRGCWWNLLEMFRADGRRKRGFLTGVLRFWLGGRAPLRGFLPSLFSQACLAGGDEFVRHRSSRVIEVVTGPWGGGGGGRGRVAG